MSVFKKDNFIFTQKIILENDDYVVLREPNVLELNKMDSAENDNEKFKIIASMFPDLIVEHSFTNEDGTTTANKDVAEELKKSSTKFTNIMREYMEHLPFNFTDAKAKK